MAGKVEQRRAILREKLIEIAEAKIAAGGLHALKARDIAKEAGCATGAIYTHFDDLSDLVMNVNARTFRALGQHVTSAVQAKKGAGPHDRMIVMSHAYLEFASSHANLWRALFDLEMSTESTVPTWYLQELAAVFALIAEPLAEIHPTKTADELDLSVRALFSAVHGIVLLGLEKRISAVPLPRVQAMLTELLSEIG